jgi:hypothetical protein
MRRKRQLVTLRLALPRQTLLQVSLDPFRPNSDPARSNYLSISLQKRGGDFESHMDSSHHAQRKIDGW